jgi:hypothetical protein
VDAWACIRRGYPDPNNFNARWRKAREALGVPHVTSHSFRKTLATLIDDEKLSARIGADHLGHSRASDTQDTYMARDRVRTQVAELLDRTLNDEYTVDRNEIRDKIASDVPPAVVGLTIVGLTCRADRIRTRDLGITGT